jgi:hypothetical protein
MHDFRNTYHESKETLSVWCQGCVILSIRGVQWDLRRHNCTIRIWLDQLQDSGYMGHKSGSFGTGWTKVGGILRACVTT